MNCTIIGTTRVCLLFVVVVVVVVVIIITDAEISKLSPITFFRLNVTHSFTL